MSRKHKCIKLAKQEESTLKGMMDKGTQSVRVLKRAEILLHNHRGHEPNEIIRMVDRSMGTVYNIINRYQKEGLKIAINEKPRHGQHRRKIHEKEEAIITSIACSAHTRQLTKCIYNIS